MEEEIGTGCDIAAPTGDENEASQTQTLQEVPLALQNPVVLNNLFQLCPLKQLANLRLVCKEWHQLSLPIWRANLPVTFENIESVHPQPIRNEERFTHYFDSYLHNYLDKPETQTDKFPHRYLKLQSWHCDSTLHSLQRVWDTIGDNIQTLELFNCSFPTIEDFRKVIYQSCPLLKTLRMGRCLFQQLPEGSTLNSPYIDPAYGQHHRLKSLSIVTPPFREAHQLPVSWVELFSHFPSMVNFCFLFGVGKIGFHQGVADESARYCDEIFKAIDTVRGHDKGALPFKTFTIQPTLEIFPTQAKVRLLCKLDLPMQNAIIRFHWEPDLDDQLVEDILQVYGKRLCTIVVVVRKDSQVPLCWKFPCEGIDLSNLGFIQLVDVVCEELTFLKYTPSLQRLRITGSQYHERDGTIEYVPTEMISNSSFPNDFKQSSLTHLVCDYILTGEDIQKLVSWMPNMEKLELILNDKQFQIVCEHWRNLKGLKVLGGQLTDKGITGRNMGKEVDENQGQGECVVPNITYLKRLIYFSLWSNSSLTEASVFSGFLKLPQLRWLQVCPQPGVFGGSAGKLRERGIRLMGLQYYLNGNVSEDE